jgi:TolB-like protein/Flp pilus assembly protein TadD
MAHDVFISYSNKDKNVADAVCSILENNGLRCWIAPRDIDPGAPFAEAIIDGIKDSKIFVLIFSSNSNQSTQVIKEVDRAVHHCLAIIPFRLEDVPMSKQLEYYVSNVHWLDALTPPLEMHIGKLCKVVQRLVTIDNVGNDEIKEAFKAESIKQPEGIRTLSRFKVTRILIPAIFTLLILIIVGGVMFYRHQANIMHTARENLVKKKASDTEKSVVVLPFKNMTGKSDQDYLVQGQNDALISELCNISQVKPLRVLSGQTASVFANATRSITEIANEINVNYIVEGSVINVGDSINLQLRLVQAFPDEKLIWAKSYKSDIVNSQKLFNNIAGQIAGKIGLDLTPQNIAKLPEPHKINPVTYSTYLRGMYNISLYTDEGLKKGIEYLNEVLRTDPGDAFAYAGVALGYAEIAHGPLDPGDALYKAEAAALQAIRLDTTIAEVYTALGEVSAYYNWKFDLAEKYFKKALALNPNSAITHYHYAWCLYLKGRMEEAVVEHKLAQKYDPFDPAETAWLGGLYYYDGKYDDAIRECKKAFEIQKDYIASYYIIGLCYLCQGKFDEAIAEHKKLAELDSTWTWPLGYSYAMAGHKKEAQQIVDEILKGDITPWQAIGLIEIYAALGEKDEAFKWLDYKPYHAWIAGIGVLPEFNPLHGDPRFDEFVKKLNPKGQ